jgi:hypothetical protein
MRSTTQWSLKLVAVGALALVMLVTMVGMAFANGGKRYGDSSGREYGPSGSQYGPSGNQYGPSGNQYGPSGNQYGPSANQYGPSGNQYGRFGRVDVCIVKRHGRLKTLALPAWAAKWYLRHHTRAHLCTPEELAGSFWKHGKHRSTHDEHHHDHDD